MSKDVHQYMTDGSIISNVLELDSVEFVGSAVVFREEATDTRVYRFAAELNWTLATPINHPYKVIVAPEGVAWPGTNVGTGSKRVLVAVFIEPGPTVVDTYTLVDDVESIGTWLVLTVDKFRVAYNTNCIAGARVEPMP